MNDRQKTVKEIDDEISELRRQIHNLKIDRIIAVNRQRSDKHNKEAAAVWSVIEGKTIAEAIEGSGISKNRLRSCIFEWARANIHQEDLVEFFDLLKKPGIGPVEAIRKVFSFEKVDLPVRQSNNPPT